MRLRNKITNKICDAEAREDGIYVKTNFGDGEKWHKYGLGCLGDNWEYYVEPKKPLIKDEKIRKAIRAWAEANSYGKDDVYEFNDFSTGWKSWSLEHKGNGDDNEIHFNGGIDFDKVEHQGYYTIEELCGELQNDANMSL